MLTNPFDAFLVLSLLLAVMAIYFRWTRHLRSLSFFLLPMIVVLLTLGIVLAAIHSGPNGGGAWSRKCVGGRACHWHRDGDGLFRAGMRGGGGLSAGRCAVATERVGSGISAAGVDGAVQSIDDLLRVSAPDDCDVRGDHAGVAGRVRRGGGNGEAGVRDFVVAGICGVAARAGDCAASRRRGWRSWDLRCLLAGTWLHGGVK